MNCRRLLAVLISGAALTASGELCAAEMQGMQLLENDVGTRIVLQLDGTPDYKLFSLQNPDRLVLDLPASRTGAKFKLPAANGAVASVRTGQPTPGTLRVVFDLGGQVSNHSHVERDGASTRLIVDLSSVQSSRLASESLQTTPPSDPVAIDRPKSPSSAGLGSPLSDSTQMVGQDSGSAPTATLSAPASSEPILAVRAPVSVQAAQSVRIATGRPATVTTTASPRGETAAPSSTRVPTKTVRDIMGSARKLVVAIDAGHGGKDPGAHGPSGVREKVVTLAVARELARQINADPGMRAVLIRDGDSFVPLQQRYMKARAAQADLFISIHADASPNNTASGASVFVLSTRGASSQAARWLADQENAADLVGGVSLQKDHNLAAVLLDLSQSATMRASDDIANQVLGSLKQVGKAHKPSIERANFVVLRSPDVPSMLIETGFITNPSEEQRLNDSGYRSRLASAISDGVRRYFVDQAPVGSWYASHEELRPTSRMHVVSRGETLSLIAARHGVGVDRIRQANRRQGDAVQVGERLTIPLMASSPK